MGIYDDYKKEKKSSGSIYEQFKASKAPKESGGFLKGVSAVISGGKDVLKAIVTPNERQMETERVMKNAMPQYSKSNSRFVRAVTAPGTAVARGVFRGVLSPAQTVASRLTPGIQNFANTQQELREVRKKDGVADMVARGDLPVSELEKFPSFRKTNTQVLSEFALAGLEVASPKLTSSVVKKGMSRKFTEALAEGFVYGTAYGGADYLTVNEDIDPLEFIKSLATGGIAGSVFSGALAGTISVAPKLLSAIEKFTGRQAPAPVKIRVQSNTPTRAEVKVNTPKSRAQDYYKKQGYEQITAEGDLPTIDFGEKGKLSGIESSNLQPPDVGKKKLSEYEPYTRDADLPEISFGAKGKNTSNKKAGYDSSGNDLRYESIKEKTDNNSSKSAFSREDDRAVQNDLRYEPIKQDVISTIIKEGKDSPAVQKIASDSVPNTLREDIEPQFEKGSVEQKRVDGRGNTFEAQTNKEQVEVIAKKDIEEVKDIAFKRRASKDNIPAEAHLAYLKNEATRLAEEGDVSLAIEMSAANAGRQSGQNFQALNIAAQDNVVDIIADLRIKKEQALPKRVSAKKDQEINKLYNDIKDSLDSTQLDRGSIKNALSKLICK